MARKWLTMMVDHGARLRCADETRAAFESGDKRSKAELSDSATELEAPAADQKDAEPRQEYLPHCAVTFDSVADGFREEHGREPDAQHPARGELRCILNVDAAEAHNLPKDWGTAVSLITLRPEGLLRPFCQLGLCVCVCLFLLCFGRVSPDPIALIGRGVGPRGSRTRWPCSSLATRRS